MSETPSAEIVTIGTELLLGQTLDTNTRDIAQSLRRIGLDLFRTTTVGDNPTRIAAALREALARASVVLTTGGLGPTVDDPTREAAAIALGADLVFQESLWADIQERFARFGRTPTENNRRQAYLPRGATAITNPIGTAPAFCGDLGPALLICLPGVPAEMRWLLEHEVEPLLGRRFGPASPLTTRIVRLAGVGESWVDHKIRDLEEGVDPTLGILAHPGRIDLRLATRAASPADAAARLDPLEAELLARLGAAVYGTDDTTLESAVLSGLSAHGWRLAVVDRGTHGSLAGPLGDAGGAVGLVLPADHARELDPALRDLMLSEKAQAGLGVEVAQTGHRHTIRVVSLLPDGPGEWTGTYGGPGPSLGPWAASLALDHLRRRLP